MLNLDANIIINWVGSFILLVLALILSRASAKKKYYNVYLNLSIYFSFIATIFENIMYHIEKDGNNTLVNLFFAIHLLCFSLQFFFVFMFFTTLAYRRPKVISIIFISCLLAVIVHGSWVQFIYFPQSSYKDGTITITISRLAFDFAGVYLWGFYGMTKYIQYYKKTKDKYALIFMITLFSIMSGYFVRVIREFHNLLYYYNPDQFSFMSLDGESPIIIFFNIFGMIGAMIFMLLYITNIKYIYRLPDDIYFLGIYTISGLQIYKLDFKTSKSLIIEDRLLSGVFSAFHSIFKTLFQSPYPIEIIKSKKFSLVFFAEDSLILVAATDHPTYILENAMKQFFKQFKQEFPNIYENNYLDLRGIEKVEEIIHERFPFLEIVKNQTIPPESLHIPLPDDIKNKE